MKITLRLPEKQVRDLVADLVPKLLNSKTQDHELTLEFEEKKVAGKMYDGKKKVSKKGNSLVLIGNYSEVVLEKSDLKKYIKAVNTD